MNINKLFARKKHVYIPVTQFAGMGIAPKIDLTAGTVGTNMEAGLASDADGALVGHSGVTADREVTGVRAPTSASTGAPVLAEVGTSGIVGLLIEAVNDAVTHALLLPSEFDRRNDLGIRAHFCTASTTTTDGITWYFGYTKVTCETTALSAAATTALDTVIAEKIIVGSSKWERTARGILKGGSIADTVNMLKFLMTATATDITLASEATYLLGVELDFTPKWGKGLRGAARDWAAN